MYIVKDKYGNVLERTVNPRWLKQQKLVDFPISADSYEEANGIVLSDENMYGIYKVDKETGESVVPNMNNYPQVTVEEISGEPYIMQQLAAMKEQNTDIDTKLDAQQALTLTSLQGQADQYTTALDMQAQIDAQQQLNLTALQGIADLYAALLTLQTPTTTETEE